MKFKKCKRDSLRCISIIVLACFFTTSLAQSQTIPAQPESTSVDSLSDLKAVSIPEQIGRIDELYLPEHADSKSPLIVYLQDAHANLGAQENIAKIANTLEKQLKIDAIFKEGGSGEADLSRPRNFPNQSIKDSVTKFWMKEGVLSGIEREAIVGNKPYRFFGIEDERVYQQGSQYFVETHEKAKSLLATLNQLWNKNLAKRKDIFNPDLLRFENLVEKFESKHELIPLVELIANEARNLHINRWKYLEVEKFIDLILIELEGGQSERFFEIQKKLDSKKLFQEIEALKSEVKEALFQNKKERILDREAKILRALKAVVQLEATPQDFDFFQKNKPAIQKYLSQRKLESAAIETAEKFYNSARERDLILFSNIQNILDSKEIKRAFLVAGGFHSQNITEQFRKHNIAYMVVSPQISDENNFESYYARIAGKRASLDYFKSHFQPTPISSTHAPPAPVLNGHEAATMYDSFEIASAFAQRAEVRTDKPTVGIIGLNQISHGWADYYQQLGAKVHIYDSSEESWYIKFLRWLGWYQNGNLKNLIQESDIIYINIIPKEEEELATNFRKRLYYVINQAGDALNRLRQKNYQDHKTFVIRSVIPFNLGDESASETQRIQNLLTNKVKGNVEVIYQPVFLKRDSTILDIEKEQIILGTPNGGKTTGTDQISLLLNKIEPEIVITDARSAELNHFFTAAYLKEKLAHPSQFTGLFHVIGGDINAASLIAGLDKRYSTAYNKAGLGAGGWLEAVTKILFQWLEKKRLENPESFERTVFGRLWLRLRETTYINENQVNIFKTLIDRHLRKFGLSSLSGQTIAFLGVADGPESKHVQESPALKLIEWALDKGVKKILVYEPYAQDEFIKWFNKKKNQDPHFETIEVELVDYEQALRNSALTIIGAAHRKIMELSPDTIAKNLGQKPLFDGWNIYGLQPDGELIHGLEEVHKVKINYVSLGRKPIGPVFRTAAVQDSRIIKSSSEIPVPKEPSKKVVIFGSSYVGLVTAVEFAENGHQVIVVDRDKRKIEKLNEGESPIYEPGLDELIAKHRGKNLFFTTDKEMAIRESEGIFIAVGTPSTPDGAMDFKYIEGVAKDIGEVIRKVKDENEGKVLPRKEIIIKSTVTPDAYELVPDLLKREFSLEPQVDYGLGNNPEFLQEGTAIDNVQKPDRLGFGGDKKTWQFLLELYRPRIVAIEEAIQRGEKVPSPKIVLTNVVSAAMAKYFANTFLASNITFADVSARIAKSLGASWSEILAMMRRDPRISPFWFGEPGCGYGGSCFPKDLKAILRFMEYMGFPATLLHLIVDTNDWVKQDAFVRQVVEVVTGRPWHAQIQKQPLRGYQIGIWGLAFKANTDDVREAPSLDIIPHLMRLGAKVVVHDPLSLARINFINQLIERLGMEALPAYLAKHPLDRKLKEAAQKKKKENLIQTLGERALEKLTLNGTFQIVSSPYEAAEGSDALVLLTEWKNYSMQQINFQRVKEKLRSKILIAGRPLYSTQEMEDLGFRYSSVRDRDVDGTQEALGNDATRSEARQQPAIVTLANPTSSRAEVRSSENEKGKSWAEENVPELSNFTVVQRQFEAGLHRGILQKLERRYGRKMTGLVAETTLTGGLGALMHDEFEATPLNGIDQTAINIIYDQIKGQQFNQTLPEEVRTGKVILGDLLQSVLDRKSEFDFSLKLQMGDDFRRKAQSHQSKAAKVINRKLHVQLSHTKTFSSGMPDYRVRVFFYDAHGNKIQIFDEPYPDDYLWRDVQIAVYGWVSQILLKKLQEKNLVKQNIIFSDNEVFASTPTPLFPDAIHDHRNHTVFRPGLYSPDEASYEMLGYSPMLHPYIVRDGKINMTDAVGLEADMIAGVGLIEHTPVLAHDIFASHLHKLKGYNENGVRSSNGVFLGQWQSPMIRELISHFKNKIGLSKSASDQDLFNELEKKEHHGLLGKFQTKFEFIKAALTAELLLWLKNEQAQPLWMDQIVESYQSAASSNLSADQLVSEFEQAVQKAIQNEDQWNQLQDPTSNAYRLKELLMANPIVSNIRRQVSYKGPDKWREILDGLKFLKQLYRNEEALTAFKADAARVIIGGRIFGSEASRMFNDIKNLINELDLKDRIITIEDYNLLDAPIIFQGVSGTVMLSDEFLEAAATTPQKVVTDGGVPIGVWGGIMPELFVIVDTKTGKEIDVFKDKVTYNGLVEKLEKHEWEITNGFLIRYSNTELSSQDGGGRRPLAESLVHALKELAAKYRDGQTRRNLQFNALKSSPRVDMQLTQSRAHAKMRQQVIKTREEEGKILGKIKLSAHDTKKLLSKKLTAIKSEFVWKKDDRTVLEVSSPGLFGFIEGFRRLRTRGRDAYLSVAYHANKGNANDAGDIFAYLDEFFQGLDNVKPVVEKIKQLRDESLKVEEVMDQVRLNFAALELIEKLVVQISGQLFVQYVESKDRNLEKYIGEQLFRENLARYFDKKAQRFGSIAKKIHAFSIPMNGKAYIVAINLGEYRYPSPKGPKAWGGIYSRRIFQELMDHKIEHDGYDNGHHIISVVDAVTNERYRFYTVHDLLEQGLAVGVPSPDVQVLKLEDTGQKAEIEPELIAGAHIVRDIVHLIHGQTVRNDQVITKALIERITSYTDSPESFESVLRPIVRLSPENARKLFGEALPAVMALVAMIAPTLLEGIQDWNVEVYEKFHNLYYSSEMSDLFKKGKIYFHNLDRDSGIAISRTLEGKENMNIIVPIHFSKEPYNRVDGKVWFRLLDIDALNVKDSDKAEYQVWDLVLGNNYPLVHIGSQLSKYGWSIGVPVILDQVNGSGIQQTGWHFQILQLRQLRAVRVEHGIVEPSLAARAEVRTKIENKIPTIVAANFVSPVVQQNRMIISLESLEKDPELRAELRSVLKENAKNKELKFIILAPHRKDLAAEKAIFRLFPGENPFLVYNLEVRSLESLGAHSELTPQAAMNRSVGLEREAIGLKGQAPSAQVVAIAEGSVLRKMARLDTPKVEASRNAPIIARLLFDLDGKIDLRQVAGPSGIISPTDVLINSLQQSIQRHQKIIAAA